MSSIWLSPVVFSMTWLGKYIFQAIDDGKEVRVVFCAFDSVWHGGLLFKRLRCGKSGNLLYWFRSYLQDRSQQLIIEARYIFHNKTKTNSKLVYLTILFYTPFISWFNCFDLNSSVRRLFADATSLYFIVDDPINAAQILNSDLGRVSNWANRWPDTLNSQQQKSWY